MATDVDQRRRRSADVIVVDKRASLPQQFQCHTVPAGSERIELPQAPPQGTLSRVPVCGNAIGGWKPHK